MEKHFGTMPEASPLRFSRQTLVAAIKLLERMTHAQFSEFMLELSPDLISLVGEHIEHLPDRVRSKCLWFHDHFAGVETNSLFSIYDPVLNDAVRTFAKAWDMATSYGVKYDTAGGDLYSFKRSGRHVFTDDDEKAWSAIAEARKVMRESLDQILARVRSHYHEVDIKKTNEEAWRDYNTDVIEEDKKFDVRLKRILASARKSATTRKPAAKKMGRARQSKRA